MMLARFFAASGCARVSIVGACALLLTWSVHPPGARADHVTWQQCKRPYDDQRRVLGVGQDDQATEFSSNYCSITKLELNTFTTLPNLEIIDISANDIDEVNPEVFKPVPNVTLLYLSFNKLRNVPLFGIYALFPRLSELYLNSNRIKSINDSRSFSACKELAILYLDHNQIEHINPDAFKPLTNLVSLILGFNKLTIIPDALLKINTLKFVGLESNNIEYVSPNAFSKNISQMLLQENKIRFLPRHIESVFSEDGSLSFYQNPWHCSCLLEVIADMKRAGIHYSTWPYDGTRPSCAYVGYECERVFPAQLPPATSVDRTLV